MADRFVGPELARLIELMSRIPGLGPRSARRAVLQLLKKRDGLMRPLADALADAAEKLITCRTCGNYDTLDPCSVCAASGRDDTILCVVEDVGSLWALERAGVFRGRYHILGGVMSALDGVGPDDLNLASLLSRMQGGPAQEVILALSATVDGQTTAHYIAERLAPFGVRVTRLAQGVPIGGELDHLDEGTLFAALSSRALM
jgi:recombination protein RecR